MRLLEMFYEFVATYDSGMGIEIKEYLSSSNVIDNYKLSLSEDKTIVIDAWYIGKDEKQFIYDFLEFISYEDFCYIYRQVGESNSTFYIYTKIREAEKGIKIVLKMNK